MCFYACPASVVVPTLTVLFMPFCVQWECKQGVSEGDVVFEMEHPTVAIVVTVARYLALPALYGGFSAVIVTVFLISHPTDVSLAPPISLAMQYVMNLTLQYFAIYLVLFVSITVQQFTGSRPCTRSSPSARALRRRSCSRRCWQFYLMAAVQASGWLR